MAAMKYDIELIRIDFKCNFRSIEGHEATGFEFFVQKNQSRAIEEDPFDDFSIF